jgi:radical SAM superfamily enzyme YgiQ (UPF0313 family)
MLAKHIQAQQTDVLLATLNARYIHSAFGLRYLKANLGEFEDRCDIHEFTLESRPEDIVEQLLLSSPKVVGFGVYIWNVVQTECVVALLKAVAPEVIVVLGGPEVSHENDDQAIVGLSDYVITGWGETSFRELLAELLPSPVPSASNVAEVKLAATSKIIVGKQPKLEHINMPYYLYNDDDITNRVLYVEASRGCPFKCEFCLSALDKTAWPFDLDAFLEQMDILHQRGARHFKFVDRTFNLKIKNSLRILEFFLARMSDELFLHFEVVPDHLPEALKDMIAKFPAGSLQFEIGIQTFNPEVQSRISRRQNNEQAKLNLVWIRDHTKAYVHADLIFGLPGESVDSFASSFNQLYELKPHEIQVGILKRLKGSPIVRHTEQHQLVFNPNPPFSILSSDTVDYTTVQFVNRFARYWDLIGNSGRFKKSLPLLLGDAPFDRFSVVVRALFEITGQTHKISLLRFYDLIHQIGLDYLGLDPVQLINALRLDHAGSGLKSAPKCLVAADRLAANRSQTSGQKVNKSRNSRQARH